MKLYKYLAYPKINLFLIVYQKKNRQRLHKIDSLFYKYKFLYDEIIISISLEKKHKVVYFNIEKNQINDCLITKTLNYLSSKKIINNFYSVSIKKMIPIFSGLGGASTDLASVLKHISNEEKISMRVFKKEAINISSDLLFFLYEYDLARIYGYGNRIKKINIKLNLNISLIINNTNCSTRDVFNSFKKNKNNNTNFKKQLSFLIEKKYDLLSNDLKETSLNLYPDLKKIYDNYVQNSKIVLMTGSGSTLFVLDN